MTALAWITLVVRGIGLWSLIYGVAGMVESVFSRPADLFRTNTSPRPLLGLRDALAMADELVWFGAGLYLLLGGRLLIKRFCAEVVGRCAKCGYDLREVKAGSKCPECGTPKLPE